MYEIAAHITMGRVRTKNDDRISICENVLISGSTCIKSENIIAVVIDGVGGEMYGDVAAQAAADTISSEYKNLFEPTAIYANKLEPVHIKIASKIIANVRFPKYITSSLS